MYLRVYADQKLGYTLPNYLGISTGGFYHSLLKMLSQFGRENGLLFEKKSKKQNQSTFMKPSIR